MSAELETGLYQSMYSIYVFQCETKPTYTVGKFVGRDYYVVLKWLKSNIHVQAMAQEMATIWITIECLGLLTTSLSQTKLPCIFLIDAKKSLDMHFFLIQIITKE